MLSLIGTLLTSLFLVTLLLELPANAAPCNLNKTAKLNCELKWSEGHDQYRLQLVTDSQGCAARSPDSDKCASFRLCKGNEIAGLGATALSSPSGSTAYCASDKIIDLFVSDRYAGPKAYVECENGKPKHVRLLAPDSVQSASAKTQVCKFPLWQVSKASSKK
jgi:hypothetical protein